MRKIDYDKKETENTETLIAVDETPERKFGNLQRAYNEGFAASNGVQAGTAETSGRILHPEKSDKAKVNSPVNPIEDENPGLADN